MSIQREIAAWADETFGRSSTPLRIAVRANEELAELLRSLACEGAPEKITEEAADTAIIIYRLADVLNLEEEAIRLYGTPVPVSFNLAMEGALCANKALHDIMVDMPHRQFRANTMRTNIWQVLWCLHVVAARVGLDLRTVIEAKMEVNRAREWKLDGTGHGCHL